MRAPRLKVCLAILAANGLVGVGQASAQELVDVAALEAQVEAAAELAELPAESDWGVQDLSNLPPVVEQDAPAGPSPAPAVDEADSAPRYHRQGPQYHIEYQPPEADPVPVPVDAPAASPSEQEPERPPATPVSAPPSTQPAEVPATVQTPSSPTIWIWVWNWNWVQGSDERYHNSEDQYHFDASTIDQNLARIIDRIGVQVPVQIGGQTADDIVADIVTDVGLEEPPAPVQRSDQRAPARRQNEPLARQPHGRAALARLDTVPLKTVPLDVRTVPPRLVLSEQARPAARKASKGEAPRVHRASRPAPTLPLPAERFADSGKASSATAGIFLKSFAVLIASLVLAALGLGRRLRLPSPRWRGLLGTRTDPPG